MADISPSMRGQACPAVGSPTSRGSTTGRSSSSSDSQAPQPHIRRPPAGICMERPQVLQRIFGIGVGSNSKGNVWQACSLTAKFKTGLVRKFTVIDQTHTRNRVERAEQTQLVRYHIEVLRRFHS